MSAVVNLSEDEFDDFVQIQSPSITVRNESIAESAAEPEQSSILYTTAPLVKSIHTDRTIATSRVSQSTVIHTKRLSTQLNIAAIDFSTVTTTVLAGELSKLTSPTIEKHNNIINTALLIGANIGSILGYYLTVILTIIANNAGSHQCNNCLLDGLYNYYICKNCNPVIQYDLCESCYSKYNTKNNNNNSIHSINHLFIYHNNSLFTLNWLLITVSGLIVTKIIGKFIFGI